MLGEITRKRTLAIASLALGAGLVAAGAAYAYLTQVPVLTGTPDQSIVAAKGNMLAWSRNSATNSGPYDAYVRIGSGPIKRVNPVGTTGWPGGFSGDRLIFQQVSASGQSDLRFYNAVTGSYGVVPTGWNTKLWEWRPSISGPYVLFGRITFASDREVILLGNLTTGHVTLLAALTGKNAVAEPGQVNGNYATWMSCPNYNVSCDVYEYNITSGVTSKVSNTFPSGKFQTNPSVASNGTVYFFHAALACGADVSLNKRALGASRTMLTPFAHGLDGGDSYVDDSNGTPIVYYSRVNCAAHQADIYKVVD